VDDRRGKDHLGLVVGAAAAVLASPDGRRPLLLAGWPSRWRACNLLGPQSIRLLVPRKARLEFDLDRPGEQHTDDALNRALLATGPNAPRLRQYALLTLRHRGGEPRMSFVRPTLPRISRALDLRPPRPAGSPAVP